PTLSLTFTPANWNTPQTVNVQAIDDLVDEAPTGTSYGITLLHVVGGGDPIYTALAPVPLTVTILENDTAGLIFAPATLTVVEGSPGDYAITLSSAPADNVTVTINGQGFLLVNGSATTTLTFTPTNWNTPQLVSVLEPNVDQIAQPNRNRIILHDTTSPDPIYNGLGGIGLPVTVIDDDIPAIIPSTTTLTLTEGTAGSYTLELGTQPTANVTITIDGQGIVLVNGSPVATLTFTPASWNIPQFVVVYVPDDNIAEATQTVVLSHVVSSTDPFYNGLLAPDVEVIISDNDSPGFFVTTPPTPLTVSENGDSITLQMRLTSQPTAPVQLNITVDDPTEGSVTPSSIVFDNTNWNINAVVLISGVDDTLEDGHQPFTVQFAPAISADPFYNGLAPANLNVINRDNEPVRISINDVLRLESDSGVTNGNFIVRLNRISDRDILVDYTSANGTATAGTDYNAVAGTVTIPAGTWQVTLPVGIIGDTEPEDDEFFTINLSNPRATMPGQPSNLASDETVVIDDGLGVGTIRDDDPPAVRFAGSEFFVNESDGTATVIVNLSRAATGTVTINYVTVTGGTAQPGDGSAPNHDYAPVSGTLTFAPGVMSQTFTIPIWNNSFADQPFETI
ncbi:Calx-beta domain-containing protein, partial [Chloroflexus sp.]|uniref:Calx-beta domain-containing protein n=1 Tax=Chloroflexus sp. TaxID=1904827 RepID=UPI003C763DEC